MESSLKSLLKHAIMMVLLLLPYLSYAQKEAAIWYLGNGNVLDFNSSPVAVRSDGPLQEFNNAAATYTDKSGKLLFYANYDGIFNSDGSLMQNGALDKVVLGHDINIIPKPGDDNSYYVFYIGETTSTSTYDFRDLALMYAIVDFAGGGRAGEVRNKDVVIYADLHGFYTLSAQCANGDYWLVGETNWNVRTDIGTDQLVAYRITSGGIAASPVVSAPVSIGNSSHLKFSPNGNKLVFNYSGQGEGFGLVNFDINTGKISNLVVLESSGWTPEFSASGEMLYLVTDFLKNRVLQYDISLNEAQQIRASKTVVYEGDIQLNDAQLAPDGRIYIVQPNSAALAVINYPELKGTACKVAIGAISLAKEPAYYLPTFATNLLYDYPIKPDAGPDKDVCVGQSVPIGGSNAPGYSYQWHPSEYLSDPQSPNPTFRYTGQLNEAQEYAYTLTVDDGVCERADEVQITVMPIPKPKITGSRSVCPAVEGVAYSTLSLPNHIYRWAVAGGQMTSGQGTAAITVNWGPTNAAAQVQVTAVSAFGCESEQAVLPVRINVALKPETPQGPESICLNKKEGNAYEVVHTNGSVYTWGISGGVITGGQGSSKVAVTWNGLGTHQIWIQEKSVTADTVCFGSSDTLQVHVYQDPTLLNLNYVSIDPGSADDRSTLTGRIDGALLNSGTVTVTRRELGATAWAEVTQAKKDSVILWDDGLRADDEIYEYQLLATNDCDELITSTVHRTIRLTGQADFATDKITLSWSAYEGWPAGVARYEVWGKLDEEKEYKLIQQLDNSFTLSDMNGSAGFNHRYRIKALAANAAWESWSNEVDFAFEHKLVIPNIFTPNGDGFNDAFNIPKIELYPDNELTILNRSGREVLRLPKYNSTWNGDNVVAGMYYYYLYIKRLDTYYKGWVEIIK